MHSRCILLKNIAGEFIGGDSNNKWTSGICYAAVNEHKRIGAGKIILYVQVKLLSPYESMFTAASSSGGRRVYGKNDNNSLLPALSNEIQETASLVHRIFIFLKAMVFTSMESAIFTASYLH